MSGMRAVPYEYVYRHPHRDGGECVAVLTLAIDRDGAVFRVPDRCPVCGEALSIADIAMVEDAAEIQAMRERGQMDDG